jgi:spermidine synthase
MLGLAALQGFTGCRRSAHPTWAEPLFPYRYEGSTRVDNWGAHRALVYGGRVYGSNGDDMNSQVVAALAPLAFVAHVDPSAATIALIGIGSGVELSTLLAAGASVDLYESDEHVLANARALIEPLGVVTFRDGIPTHRRLRVVRSIGDAPSRAPAYDAVLHANAATVLSGPPALFTVQRFGRLARLLRRGGVVGIHIQLYEIQPDVHRVLVATFAAAFPHVVMLSTADGSSDALLYGSMEPLRLAPARIRAVVIAGELPRLRARLPTTVFARPLDLASLTLLRDHDEATAYIRGELPWTDGNPFSPDRWPRRPPLPDPNTSNESAMNAWDRARVEWTDAQHFPIDFESTFYADSWTWGDPCTSADACPLLGPVTPAERAEIALSELAHGRIDRADASIRAARAGNETQRSAHVEALLAALRGDTPSPAMQASEIIGARDASAESLFARLSEACEHSNVCNERPAGWYWLARSSWSIQDHAGAVDAMEQWFRRRPTE